MYASLWPIAISLMSYLAQAGGGGGGRNIHNIKKVQH